MLKVVTKRDIQASPRAEDLELIESEAPTCKIGGVLVRVVYLSLEPYIGSILRGRHFSSNPPAPFEDSLPGSVVAQVIETQSPRYQVGDWVYIVNGRWEETSSFAEDELIKIDPQMAPLHTYTGVLGIPGLTAWASATQLAEVQHGDVALVNAAAGAVGGTFGQLARLRGARVIGVAGGAAKCGVAVDTYGFDECVDYTQDGWQKTLKQVVPDGISVFHENVSAEMTMLALSLAKPSVRGVLCGLANAYQADTQQEHPINAGYLIMKRAQLFGLVVYDFLPKWHTFIKEVAPLVQSNQISIKEDRAIGLKGAPALFEKLMNADNIGKAVVVLSEE